MIVTLKTPSQYGSQHLISQWEGNHNPTIRSALQECPLKYQWHYTMQ